MQMPEALGEGLGLAAWVTAARPENNLYWNPYKPLFKGPCFQRALAGFRANLAWNSAGRHAGFAVRDAKRLFEMQNFCISGRHP